MGGGNAKGIHAVIPFDWNSTPEDSRIRWHTGDPETDPWEWRMRVLKERDDIAYAKVFFGTSGYITKEWYPLFLTVRRHGMVFDEWYDEGKASQMESSIYKAISENGQVALHDLKRICSIQKEDASRFDRALVSRETCLSPCAARPRKKIDRGRDMDGTAPYSAPWKIFGKRTYPLPSPLRMPVRRFVTRS